MMRQGANWLLECHELVIELYANSVPLNADRMYNPNRIPPGQNVFCGIFARYVSPW